MASSSTPAVRLQNVRLHYVWLLIFLSFSGTVMAIVLQFRDITLPRQVSFLFENATGWSLLLGGYILVAVASMLQGNRYQKSIVSIILFGLLAPALYQLTIRIILGFPTFGDFGYYYDGAQALIQNENIYARPGIVAFPFPSFHIVALASLWGRFDIHVTYYIFFVTNLGLWLLISAWLIQRSLHAQDTLYGALTVYLLLASAAYSAISLGQTTILLLFLLTLFIAFALRPAFNTNVLAAICLSIMVLIKPYFALLVGFIGMYGWLNRSHQALTIALVSAFCIPTVIIFTLATRVVDVGTYQEFFLSIYPSIAHPEFLQKNTVFNGLQGNSSPVAMVAKVVGPHFGSASSVLTLMLFLALLLFIMRSNRIKSLDLPHFVLAVLVPLVLIPKVFYSNYTAWLLLSCIALLPFVTIQSKQRWILLLITSYGVLLLDNPYGNMLSIATLSLITFQAVQKGLYSIYPSFLLDQRY